MSGLPVWRTQLEAALKDAPIHKDFCMATAAAHGNTPRVRHVTHQGFSPSNLLLVGTDRSSGKVHDLVSHPQMEIAWFIPPYQFRIRGRAVVIGEAGEFARSAHYLGLPNSAPDADYAYWRAKKEEILASLPKMLASGYDHAPERGARVPHGVDNVHWNFVLIAIVPSRVEVLSLMDKSYHTYVLSKKGWVEEKQPPKLKELSHI